MKHVFLFAALMFTTFGVCEAGEIQFDDLAKLPPSDVTILGEIHDNGLHHLAQAAAITAIKPKAVVFEMLTVQQAALITAEVLADQDALRAALQWEQSGWPDFALYYPVFAALGDAKIYGAARPRDEVRRAFSEGAAAVLGRQISAPFGLKHPLAPAQLEQRTQAQFEAHCGAMPLEMMGGMVEAQRFRDAAFAVSVIRAMAETGGPVVLIAGNGHARIDWAVPYMLKSAIADLSVLSVGILERPVMDAPPFDLWLQTDAARREDPCLAFK